MYVNVAMVVVAMPEDIIATCTAGGGGILKFVLQHQVVECISVSYNSNTIYISVLFKCAMYQGTLGHHCPMKHCNKMSESMS